ncbi:hypothetical protein [Massilia sp. erpn]|uniref:hypothetical protein n=1 Tax=Massilia sp. erpn TaxID=2738142 RepID=UPI0021054D0C|nr:hypothetical protein [Massilia sp. erpn]UTY60206.1 hypothetical protein HPQ68_25275 [Massilia sp. erpn]
MKKFFALAAMAAILLYFAWPSGQNTVPAAPSAPITTAASAAGKTAVPAAPAISGAPDSPSWARSPFGRAVPLADSRPRPIERRKEQMKAGGYYTPEEYFTLPLKELQTRAKAGDIYALLQLGQQYYYEGPALQEEEGYQLDEDPRFVGKRHFAAAAVGGHGQMPAVLAQLYAAEGDMVNAYAWQLFGEQLGEHYAKRLDISKLNNQEQNLAQQQARQLLGRFMSRAPAGGIPPQ